MRRKIYLSGEPCGVNACLILPNKPVFFFLSGVAGAEVAGEEATVEVFAVAGDTLTGLLLLVALPLLLTVEAVDAFVARAVLLLLSIAESPAAALGTGFLIGVDEATFAFGGGAAVTGAAAGVVVSLPDASGAEVAAAGALALSACALLSEGPTEGIFLSLVEPATAAAMGVDCRAGLSVGVAAVFAPIASPGTLALDLFKSEVLAAMGEPACGEVLISLLCCAEDEAPFGLAAVAAAPPATTAPNAPPEAAATAPAFSPPTLSASAAVVKSPVCPVTLAANPLLVTGTIGAPCPVVALLATVAAAFAFSVVAAAGSLIAPPCGSKRERSAALSPFTACASVSFTSFCKTGSDSGLPRMISAPVTVATALAMTGMAP